MSSNIHILYSDDIQSNDRYQYLGTCDGTDVDHPDVVLDTLLELCDLAVISFDQLMGGVSVVQKNKMKKI